MALIWFYISMYLAIGAGIGSFGILVIRMLGKRIGRLSARIDIRNGDFDIDKVEEEIAETRKEFDDNVWWITWWTKTVVLWPRAIIAFAKTNAKQIQELNQLKKQLKE